MLKKKDLVKQFELVVQQEIIEHNKAISASNLAVNKLNDKIEEYKKNSEFQIHALKTHNDSFKREVESFINDYKKVSQEFVKLKNDQFILNERNHKEIEGIEDGVEIVHKNFKDLVKQFESLKALTYAYMDKIEELKKIHEDGVYNVRYKVSKDINNLRKDIVSLPSENVIVKLKDELMEILSMNKIDNEGLLREIKVLKKTVFINEKKIEHLNTLIERMNKN